VPEQDIGMTVTGRLDLAAFDAQDTETVAKFYADLAGWEIVRNDGGWINVKTGDGQEIGFQPSDNHVPPEWPGQERPQQFHLDLLIDDYQAAAERAVSLGATRLADGKTWVTLADPAGHPFDLCQRDGVGPVMELFAVTIDAPDAVALAHFYADLLGMEVTYEGPEGAMIAGDGKTVMFQQVSEYTRPQWPDPAHPQQAHLDIFVDDLDAAEARAVELGATVLKGGDKRFRTLEDPAGHPFDLSLSGS
jgi:predicted enzyme related to lactoylglutathione lyase